MYDVSQEYIDAIMSDSVYSEWFGTITTEGDTVYNIKEENIALGGSSFVSECVSGDAIEFGNAFSKQLKLQIYLDYDAETNTFYINGKEVNRYDLYNAEIKMTFRLYFDEEYTQYEDVELPIFTVIEPTWQNDLLTLSAFDYMKKFEKELNTQSTGTIYNLLSFACENCGVELGMTKEEVEELPNGNITVGMYRQEEYIPDYISLVRALAQITGGNAYISSDDKLLLKNYDHYTARTISADWRFSSEISDYLSFYTQVREHGDNDELVIGIPKDLAEKDSELWYDMGLNPLMQYGTGTFKKAIATEIATYLYHERYTPFTITTPLDPALEIMDCINLVDNQAVDGKIGVLTSVEYALNGSMTLKCVGQNPKSKFTSPVESAIASYGGGGGEGSKIVFRDYTNVEELTVKTGDTRKKLFVLDFFANSSTHISMQAEINHTMTVDDGYNYGHIVITYVLYFNGYSKEVNYTPTQDEFTGNHLLHLLYNFTAEENSLGRLEAYINVTWGTFHVEPENVIAGLWGQRLSGEIDWDGRIDVQEDDIPLFKLDLQTEPMQDNVNIAFKDPILINKNENMSLFELDLQTERIAENVTHKEEVE